MPKIEFLAEDIWDRISALAKKSKTRHVAVAYIASRGSKMLPLSKGDVLVVDMSEVRLRNGTTDPNLIEEYMNKGVAVYSSRRLHAKVFVFDDLAVVGSTNVSSYSEEVLTEAAVLTTDSDTVRAARDFVLGLANDLKPIDRDYLAKCKKLYRKPRWLPGMNVPNRKSTHDWSWQVMNEIQPPPAFRPHHGHSVSLNKQSDAIGPAYLRLADSSTGSGRARLELYPADDIEQAKAFYQKVDLTELKALANRGWEPVSANLHFGGPFGKGWPPRVSNPPLGFDRYIEYWKEHLTEIKEYDRAKLARKFNELKEVGLISDDDIEKEDIDRLKRFKRFGIRPGVTLTFEWPTFGERLPAPATFAPRVTTKINEALNTWGDSFA